MKCLWINCSTIRDSLKMLVLFHQKDGTIIHLTVTSATNTMSVDRTDNNIYIFRASIDIVKPYYQNAVPISYYSSSTPKTASTAALIPLSALPDTLTKSSKNNKNIESMQ